MSKKIFCLRNVDLYGNICEKKLKKIAQSAEEKHIDRHTMLYSNDAPAKHVYILKEGEIELFMEESGKRVVLETLLPGDVFGDFGTGKTKHSAISTRKAYICQTPTDEFLLVVKEYPEIALRLMQSLASRTEYYENKIASLSRPAKDQILDELCQLEYKNKNSLWGKMFDIPLRISHQKLAEKTGLNRVTVTKLIGELQQSGSIKIDPSTREITIF